MTDEHEKLRRQAERIIERAKGPGEDRVSYVHPRHRQRLTEDGDDPKARKLANVEKKGREALASRLEEYREEVATTADAWGQQVRPDEEALKEELADLYNDATQDAASILTERINYLERAREQYREELPDFSSSSTPHTEREMRDVLRSMDSEERNEEVRRIVEEGTASERRAILNEEISPRNAGLQSADQRERARREIYQKEAPEAFKSIQSLETGIEGLERELARFEKAAAEIVGRRPQLG